MDGAWMPTVGKWFGLWGSVVIVFYIGLAVVTKDPATEMQALLWAILMAVMLSLGG